MGAQLRGSSLASKAVGKLWRSLGGEDAEDADAIVFHCESLLTVVNCDLDHVPKLHTLEYMWSGDTVRGVEAGMARMGMQKTEEEEDGDEEEEVKKEEPGEEEEEEEVKRKKKRMIRWRKRRLQLDELRPALFGLVVGYFNQGYDHGCGHGSSYVEECEESHEGAAAGKKGKAGKEKGKVKGSAGYRGKGALRGKGRLLKSMKGGQKSSPAAVPPSGKDCIALFDGLEKLIEKWQVEEMGRVMTNTRSKLRDMIHVKSKGFEGLNMFDGARMFCLKQMHAELAPVWETFACSDLRCLALSFFKCITKIAAPIVFKLLSWDLSVCECSSVKKEVEEEEKELGRLLRLYLPYGCVGRELREPIAKTLSLLALELPSLMRDSPEKVTDMWYNLGAGFACFLMDPVTAEENYCIFGKCAAEVMQEKLAERVLRFYCDTYSRIASIGVYDDLTSSRTMEGNKRRVKQSATVLYECMSTLAIINQDGGPVSAEEIPDLIDSLGFLPTGEWGTVNALLHRRSVFARRKQAASLYGSPSDDDKLAFNTGNSCIVIDSGATVEPGTLPYYQEGLQPLHNFYLGSIPFEDRRYIKALRVLLEVIYLSLSEVNWSGDLRVIYDRFSEKHELDFHTLMGMRQCGTLSCMFSAKEWSNKAFGEVHTMGKKYNIQDMGNDADVDANGKRFLTKFKNYTLEEELKGAVDVGKESTFFSFGDSNLPRCTLFLGTTHVSVGFMDFTELMWSNYCDPEKLNNNKKYQERYQIGEMPSATQNPNTIRYVGIDSSPYACAKSVVIKYLLEASLDMFGEILEEEYRKCILQIWFSSVWSVNTRKVFKKAVSNICRPEYMASHRFSVEMCAIFRKWDKCSPVGREEALVEWRHSMLPDRFISALNMRDTKDAVSLLRYLATGQVLDGEEGSICMFRNRPFVGSRFTSEVFFRIIPANEWLKERRHAASSIEAAASLLLNRIGALRSVVRRGVIKLEVHNKDITPDCVEYLRSFSAATVFWGDIIDYCDVEALHKLAEQASVVSSKTGVSTVNYMYSTKWYIGCKGAVIIDYEKPKQIDKIARLSLEYYARTYSSSGWDAFLISPPIGSLCFLPINYLSAVRKSHKAWVRYVLKPIKAKVGCGNVDVAYGRVSKMDYNALYCNRADIAICLTIIYKKQNKIDISSLTENSNSLYEI
eukprot:Nk52_evm9s282 gene=Nk52_evmTU9s282